MRDLSEEYIDLLVEKRNKRARLTGGKDSDWGSDDHISDLEVRLADAIYWRDSMPRGSEKRGHYRAICNQLKTELHSARRAKQLKELQTQQLQLKEGPSEMGGLVGHLQYLYENKELSFGEIKNILHEAAAGRLESVTEKMDGMNLVFSYDMSEDQVRVTRSSDIKHGGMDARALAEKFSGRGSVEEAFNKAFNVLQGAIGSLPNKVKEKVFGSSANRWYSMEVIYTKNPNVINYDSDSLVFHGWPVFRRTDEGKVSMCEDEVGGIDTLTQHVDKMQRAVASTGWRVQGPAFVHMRDLSDGTLYHEAATKIDRTTTSLGLSDNHTVGDYLKVLLEDEINKKLNVTSEVKRMIVDRCLCVEGSPTLVDIKKKLDKSKHVLVSEFVKNSPALLKGYVRPFELAITEFAVKVLSGLDSTLIKDNRREVDRLRNEVKNAVKAIKECKDNTSMDVLKKQMEKLQTVENITSPVEGVVFIYKGNAYKFTGAFAPANQILGLFRYKKSSKSKNTIID